MDNPKSGSRPIKMPHDLAKRLLGTNPVSNRPKYGTKRNMQQDIQSQSFGSGDPTPGGDVDTSGNVVNKRIKRKNGNGGPPTKGGDVDRETGDLIPESIHEYALTDKGRAALAADRAEKDVPIPPQSQVSDNMLNDILKKVSKNYKPKPKPGDPTNESVQKAGHPEAFELGLDKDTTDNKEYQKILRQKRIERALKMTDPTHPHHETDDVSQDDVEAADKAARGRKYTPRSVGRDGY